MQKQTGPSRPLDGMGFDAQKPSCSEARPMQGQQSPHKSDGVRRTPTGQIDGRAAVLDHEPSDQALVNDGLQLDVLHSSRA